jgi:hypothetical protein
MMTFLAFKKLKFNFLCSGAPPADEINILRGQIIMMENQLMYERHKRELHNKRNRRLLRKITNAETLEENNKTMVRFCNYILVSFPEEIILYDT